MEATMREFLPLVGGVCTYLSEKYIKILPQKGKFDWHCSCLVLNFGRKIHRITQEIHRLMAIWNFVPAFSRKCALASCHLCQNIVLRICLITDSSEPRQPAAPQRSLYQAPTPKPDG